MIDRFDKKLVQGTDAYEDNFFDDAEPVGNPTGIWIVYLQSKHSAYTFADWLGDDLKESVEYNDAGANNGGGRHGTLVRFRPNRHTIEEVRECLAKLP